MKSNFLSVGLLVLAALSANAAPKGNNNKGNNNKGGAGANNKGGAAAAAAASTTAAAAASTTAAASASDASLAADPGNSLTNATANNPNAQESLTLDPSVIATGFQLDGQQVEEAGQSASLTSDNNYINFCLTVPDKPITNGLQIKTGSCNPAPMGIIAATTNMPSSKFTNPLNGLVIAPNTAFTISMAVSHLQTGVFVNAQNNYYSAPQQVNGQGDIIGHTHVVVQEIDSFQSATPLDPNVFAFFKGINTAAVNGVVTADVTAGLPAGLYRLGSINTAANHQPCLVAIAQHGIVDDVVYFAVSDDQNAGAAFAGNSSSDASGAASSAANSTADNAAAGAAADNTSTAAAANSTSTDAAAATDSASVSTTDAAAATDSASTSAAAAAATTSAAAAAAGGKGGKGGAQKGFGGQQFGKGKGKGSNNQGHFGGFRPSKGKGSNNAHFGFGGFHRN